MKMIMAAVAALAIALFVVSGASADSLVCNSTRLPPSLVPEREFGMNPRHYYGEDGFVWDVDFASPVRRMRWYDYALQEATAMNSGLLIRCYPNSERKGKPIDFRLVHVDGVVEFSILNL